MSGGKRAPCRKLLSRVNKNKKTHHCVQNLGFLETFLNKNETEDYGVVKVSKHGA